MLVFCDRWNGGCQSRRNGKICKLALQWKSVICERQTWFGYIAVNRESIVVVIIGKWLVFFSWNVNRNSASYKKLLSAWNLTTSTQVCMLVEKQHVSRHVPLDAYGTVLPNSNSIRNTRTHLNGFLRNASCFVVDFVLLPLRPGSLTHKSPQRRKIIHGMRPLGSKDRSIDLNMCICKNISFV